MDGKGSRVLIVEDEALLALYLEDILTDLGHEVVGIASRMTEALAFANDLDLDFAVLDVNIAGVRSFPVAEILRERGIPFVFATGYGFEGFPDGFKDEAMLRKPYDPKGLELALEGISPIDR